MEIIREQTSWLHRESGIANIYKGLRELTRSPVLLGALLVPMLTVSQAPQTKSPVTHNSLAPRISQPLKPPLVKEKIKVSRGHRGALCVGARPEGSPTRTHHNPLREALRYQGLLESAGSRAELARLQGVSRAHVTHVLSLGVSRPEPGPRNSRRGGLPRAIGEKALSREGLSAIR